MALELPFGVKPVNPVPVEFWSGPYSGVLLQEAINTANSGIPTGVRFPSMEVNLLVNGEAEKYWYNSGIGDEFLTPAWNNDIAAVSGIAVYASGHNLQSVTDNGAVTNNDITINADFSAVSGSLSGIDFAQLVEANHPPYAEGRVFYDAENHCVTVYNDESEISLQVGQEEYIRVRNITGSGIPNGKAVYITGAQGQHTTVDLAVASGELESEAVGIATHDIEHNSFGYITTFGLVRGIDTNAFNEGDELFVGLASGDLTNVSPIAPNYKTSIGHVVVKGNNGSILVTPRDHKLGGGDAKTLGNIQQSGIAFFDLITNEGDAGILASDPEFYFDQSNNRVQLDTGGIRFSDGTTQTTAAVGTTYTAGSGLILAGDEFNVYGGSGHFINLQIENDISSNTPFTIQGATSQSANLQEWQDATGSELAHVDSGGNIYSSGYVQADRFYFGTSNDLDISQLPYLENTATNSNGSFEFNRCAVMYMTHDLRYLDIRPKTGEIKAMQDGKIGFKSTFTKDAALNAYIYRSAADTLGVHDHLAVDGTITATGVTVSGDVSVSGSITVASGVTIPSLTPASTTNTLYNVAGSLYFNGSEVGGGAGGAGSNWTIDDGNGNSEVVPSGSTVVFSGVAPISTSYNPSNNVLSISSSNRTYNNITADFSMSDASDVVFMDTTSGPINVYVPTAAGQGGKEIMIKLKAGSNSGVLIGSGVQTIDGQSQVAVYNTYESITLISDNSNWFIS